MNIDALMHREDLKGQGDVYFGIITSTHPRLFKFYPLEVLSHYSDPQLQVGEHYPYLYYLTLAVLE